MRWLVLGLIAACGCDQVFGLSRPDAAPISGLIAYYPMDDLGGSTVVDTEHHHDATCSTPTCAHPVPGRIGGALSFDGSQNFVVSAPELSTPDGFTATMWIAIDAISLGFVECPLNKTLGTGERDSWSPCLVQEPDSFPVFYSDTETTGNTLEDRDDVLPLGEWHHLAVRWDRFTKTIVLDGAPVAAATADIAFDGAPLVIGSDIDNGAPAAALIGRLDELRIYDHPLEFSEIAALAHP